MRSSMTDLENSVFNIGPGEQNSLVFDMSVKRESHGKMVGIFLTVDATLSVTMGILLLQNVMLFISLSVSYGNSQDKLHTLRGSFGEKKPVGNTASPFVLFLMKFSPASTPASAASMRAWKLGTSGTVTEESAACLTIVLWPGATKKKSEAGLRLLFC